MLRDLGAKLIGRVAPGSGRPCSPVEIALDRVSKRFPAGVVALDSVCLTVRPGEKLVVLGASGSGKSTLLRIVAGLEPFNEGRVEFDGADQAEVPAHHRFAAMIFQNPSLFPHLSVFENLAFGLRARESLEYAELQARVRETAAMLGLSGLLGRDPAALSGGERQRVAIGRAIAWRPRILLLDEPFASLDAPLRASLRDQIHLLHRQFGMTIIHVTHDQEEAFAMGDRIAILERGRIVQCDPPEKLYERPVRRSVGTFVGSPPMNFLPCLVERGDSGVSIRVVGDEPNLLGFQEWTEDGPFSTLKLGERCRRDLGIRPEQLEIASPSETLPTVGDSAAPLARVERVEFQGHERRVHFRLGSNVLILRNLGCEAPREGDFIRVRFDFGRGNWFDPVSGVALNGVENPFASGV